MSASIRPLSLFIAAIVALGLTLGFGVVLARGSKPEPCGSPGEWRMTGNGPAAAIDPAMLLERMSGQQVVLLGEQHDSAEDHRWQLHMVGQLHGRHPQLAIGFEMFPRRVQPILDDWVAGKLGEDELLKRVEWDKVWGYEARDYLPLLHYARMHRLPMLALNVERSLPEAVGKVGWEAVPAEQREGVSRPAAPSEAYRKQLRRVFDHHPAKERGEGTFPRFVEAQTIWDRAMAEVIAGHLQKNPGAQVIGILGAGHVRNGHGVAHQLKDLGVARVGSLLTWEHDESCAKLGSDFADGLFLIDEPKANAPRLGVATVPESTGLRVTEITPGSIAEAAGLQKDDLITAVGGQPAKGILTLRTAVQKQPPGTWLPLKIKRGENELEIVARFPSGS